MDDFLYNINLLKQQNISLFAEREKITTNDEYKKYNSLLNQRIHMKVKLTGKDSIIKNIEEVQNIVHKNKLFRFATISSFITALVTIVLFVFGGSSIALLILLIDFTLCIPLSAEEKEYNKRCTRLYHLLKSNLKDVDSDIDLTKKNALEQVEIKFNSYQVALDDINNQLSIMDGQISPLKSRVEEINELLCKNAKDIRVLVTIRKESVDELVTDGSLDNKLNGKYLVKVLKEKTEE